MHIYIPVVSVSSLMCNMMSCGILSLSDKVLYMLCVADSCDQVFAVGAGECHGRFVCMPINSFKGYKLQSICGLCDGVAGVEEHL